MKNLTIPFPVPLTYDLLDIRAAKEGVSINDLIVGILSAKVAQIECRQEAESRSEKNELAAVSNS